MPVISSAPDRIVAAAALARKYPNAKIVFSGGSASLISNEAREADYAAALFESLGVDKARLIMDRDSRNTYENAVLSKKLAAPKPGERWLLVTSAFHMPRSVGLFRKVGFAVEPYPVDWRVGRDLPTSSPSPSLQPTGCCAPMSPCANGWGWWPTGLRDGPSALFPGP